MILAMKNTDTISLTCLVSRNWFIEEGIEAENEISLTPLFLSLNFQSHFQFFMFFSAPLSSELCLFQALLLHVTEFFLGYFTCLISEYLQKGQLVGKLIRHWENGLISQYNFAKLSGCKGACP